MTVSNIQLELIEKAKKYLEKKSTEDINVHSSPLCYFLAWTSTPGYAMLKLWEKGFKSIFSTFKIFFKDIISISSFYNYYLINELESNKKYNKIIVSWGFKNYFLPDGSYQDRYFKINSNDTNDALWFLVYDDKILPEKINKNILIFTRSKNILKYNFFYFLKSILRKIILSKFSPKRFFHKASGYTEFSDIVWNELKGFINDDVNTIIMPYECQPFQNKIFKKIKKIDNRIKTIGYVHAFPAGLPTNYIFRDGSPEKLIISGTDQLYCFEKYLNWTNSQLKVLPSTRYSKNAKNMSGYIYLPYDIPSIDIVINSLKNLLDNYGKKIISNLIVKNHPLPKDPKKNLKTIKDINNLFLEHKNSTLKESYKSNLSIFIGSTSSPIEALERGVEVMHICDDPVFQSYTSALWPSIKVKKINENTYKYQLLKKGNLIQLGESSKTFIEGYLN